MSLEKEKENKYGGGERTNMNMFATLLSVFLCTYNQLIFTHQYGGYFMEMVYAPLFFLVRYLNSYRILQPTYL